LLRLARRDPGALFARGLAKYEAEVQDFRCRLIRRERLGGSLTPEQEIEVRYLEEPFSVYFNWVRNPQRAQKVLYVAGQHKGKMVVMPTLVGWLTGAVLVDPEGADASSSSRRPITQFGFGRMLKRLARAHAEGQLPDGGGFEDHYEGVAEVAGREVLVVERLRTEVKPDAGGQAKGWRVCLDGETLTPVAVKEFAADGSLLGEYVFAGVEFNVGLRVEDFSRAALGI